MNRYSLQRVSYKCKFKNEIDSKLYKNTEKKFFFYIIFPH